MHIKLHFNSLTKEGVSTLVWSTNIINSYLYLDTIKMKLNFTHFVNKFRGKSEVHHNNYMTMLYIGTLLYCRSYWLLILKVGTYSCLIHERWINIFCIISTFEKMTCKCNEIKTDHREIIFLFNCNFKQYTNCKLKRKI